MSQVVVKQMPPSLAMMARVSSTAAGLMSVPKTLAR